MNPGSSRPDPSISRDGRSLGKQDAMSALARFDAATIHEAYGRRGALPSDIKPIDLSFSACGPAFTVNCPAGDNLWIHRAVYAAQPGDVLVVQTRGEREAGYWGEILSEAAIARGLAGLVIDGGVRDVTRLAELGFPVFAANVCLRGTLKEPASDGRLGEPVVIGTTLVRPGDAVVGDRDGVVVVAAEAVEAAAGAASERLRKEQDVIARLRNGETTLAIYGLSAEDG
jgi:4-hydroxy-4-methyl-2-oxoglutarate aldolase